MDTKPTPTLAKLYVSQSKYDYALAIYLYLQEKESKSYSEEISEVIKAISSNQWKEYGKPVTEIFSKEEAARLQIIPESLMEATRETLADISNDFELPPSKSDEIQEETIETKEENETEVETDKEVDREEINFPTMGDEVFEEPRQQPIKKAEKVDQEDLVPGLNEFSSNYKESVSQGLIDEKANNGDKEIDARLQKDIDQKLINVLRILRSMTTEELHTLVTKKLKSGKKLEELTLADLEELLD